ncbi:MAG: hormogonium polysaccharide biosynthesis glycosyltransferase HpsE [Xenococcaceae cyanobacterium MO_188.B19]|nr:hormogonium polysaccharide biosynthesis glycosyltransferase HpsE [Xenococcaceae cyanobacterium MO_188.B19]
MDNSLDFTVAIPTYNGAKRLPKVLEKLKAQTNLENITWEVIIIDNNSSDETAKVVKEYQHKQFLPVNLEYMFEPQQGAAYARILAVKEAKGELIGFLDDDNLPDNQWIAEAYAFSKDYPQAGAYSGQIHGALEVEPPEYFENIKQFLAIREHGSKPRLFNPKNLQLPPAAALVVRKQAWLESVPCSPTLTGKLPGLMIQGDDYEPLLYIYKAGWEIWYNPAMHTDHQIPEWRLERDYLLNLARGCGLATCQLRMINAEPWQKPIIFIRTLLGNLRRIIMQYVKYQGKVKTDLTAEFESEFYWGSFLSCFYWLSKTVKHNQSSLSKVNP